jgi:phosphoglycerol transferase MdoB-like AlkP superfamily enzyme
MKLAKYFSILSQVLCDERPNVIILLADDFGLGEFRVNQANSKVPTPNIDRLANEGVNFKVLFGTSNNNSNKQKKFISAPKIFKFPKILA